MNTDSIFLQGSTHQICQDYAICGIVDNKLHYALLADGCSTIKINDDIIPHPTSDFSARLSCFAARATIERMSKNYDNVIWTISIKNFTTLLCEKLAACLSTLGLGYDDLSSTLGMLLVEKDIGVYYGIGDVVLIKETENSIVVTTKEYEPNQPELVAYMFHTPSSRNAICTKQVITINKTTGEIESSTKSTFTDFFNYHDNAEIFDPHQIKSISIFSDGINSFTDKDNKDKYLKFINFKLRNGAFVKRRAKNQIEEFKKQGIFHQDDFSMASINIGDLS